MDLFSCRYDLWGSIYVREHVLWCTYIPMNFVHEKKRHATYGWIKINVPGFNLLWPPLLIKSWDVYANALKSGMSFFYFRLLFWRPNIIIILEHHYFERVRFAYERHTESVRTVWGVGAAICVSTYSGLIPSAGSMRQIRLYLIGIAPEAPPGWRLKSSYLTGICSFAALKKLFAKMTGLKKLPNRSLIFWGKGWAHKTFLPKRLSVQKWPFLTLPKWPPKWHFSAPVRHRISKYYKSTF